MSPATGAVRRAPGSSTDRRRPGPRTPKARFFAPLRTAARPPLVAAIVLLGLAAACSSADPTTSNAPAATAADRAPATTATTAPDRETDRTAAEGALIGARDLSGSWQESTTSTRAPRPGTSQPARFIECPALEARFPGFADARNQVVVSGPNLQRATPAAQVNQVIVVFPTTDEAANLVEAFQDDEAGECVKTLLGRQPGSAPVSDAQLETSPWDIGAVGTSRAGHELHAVITDAKGQHDARVGLAFVQEGRAVSLLVVLGDHPMAAADIAVLTVADAALRDAFA